MTCKLAKSLFREFKMEISHLECDVIFVKSSRAHYKIVISSKTGFIPSPVFAHIANFVHHLEFGWYDVSISRTGTLCLVLS